MLPCSEFELFLGQATSTSVIPVYGCDSVRQVDEAEIMSTKSEDVIPAVSSADEETCRCTGVTSESETLLPAEKSAALHEQGTTAPGAVESGSGRFSRSKGLTLWVTKGMILVTIIFPVSVPYAMANATLLGGVMLILLASTVMMYMAVLVGRCWVILMETWPERYRHREVRAPYPAIAKEAGGRFWEVLMMLSISFTNLGTSVVLLLAAASTADVLLPGHFSIRVWTVICTIVLLPLVCFGTMRDSKWLGVFGGPVAFLAGLCMLLSVVLSRVFTENSTIGDLQRQWPGTGTPSNVSSSVPWTIGLATSGPGSTARVSPPHHDDGTRNTLTFSSFWVGVTTIVFTLSPMGTIPTIQHDMKKPDLYTRAVIPAYIVAVLFDLSVGVVGMDTFGQRSNPNILRNVQCRSSLAVRTMLKISSTLSCVNFLCVTMATVLPLTQHVEEAVKLPLNGECCPVLPLGCHHTPYSPFTVCCVRD